MNSSRPNESMIVNETMNNLKNPNRLNFKLYWRLSRGDYDICNSMLNKWKLQTCKNYEFGHFLQAIIHRKRGNLQESLKYIKLCHMIDQNNPTFIKELAKTFCILGKHKTALNIITKCPESNTDWELLELLGDIYTFLNDNSNAKSSYLKAIERNNSKKILLKLGKLYVHENQSDQAQVLFNEYADKSSLDSQILEELGFIYLTVNNKPEALHYLGLATVQDPTNQDILLSLGSLAQEYGDTEGAIHKYKQFYEENQNSSEMWSNLGNCYLEKEMHALSCFKRALYLNPLEWTIYFNLGIVYINMKVYSIAFHYFLTSAKYNSKNAEAYMFIGISLNKLQDPANAFNAFEKAVQIDPENHLIFLNYAIFLAEHSKDPANVRLAKDKFEIHDQLYKGMNQRDPQVDAQRNIIKSILGSESI